MKYRLNKDDLLGELAGWNRFLKKRVRLIACGGTAMTLIGVKASTKDIDFMVPHIPEYDYLIRTLKELGYEQVTGAGWSRGDRFIFDLFKGNYIHTTELLESPLEEENHSTFRELEHIYVGILNYYDLLISKIFRGTTVDTEDCLALIKAKKKEIDIEVLKKRFLETASYDTSEEKVKTNLKHFLRKLR